MPLGKKQLALKDAVLKKGDDAKPDNILAALIGPAALIRNFQNVSQLLVQYPLGGSGVSNHRNDIVLDGLVQQEPRVMALLFGSGLGGGEMESASANEDIG